MSLNVIDNNTICYKRSSLTYHDIVLNREKDCKEELMCGSLNDTDLRYCSSQCLLNNIDFSLNTTTTKWKYYT